LPTIGKRIPAMEGKKRRENAGLKLAQVCIVGVLCIMIITFLLLHNIAQNMMNNDTIPEPTVNALKILLMNYCKIFDDFNGNLNFFVNQLNIEREKCSLSLS
jgi:hypothetical protein